MFTKANSFKITSNKMALLAAATVFSPAVASKTGQRGESGTPLLAKIHNVKNLSNGAAPDDVCASRSDLNDATMSSLALGASRSSLALAEELDSHGSDSLLQRWMPRTAKHRDGVPDNTKRRDKMIFNALCVLVGLMFAVYIGFSLQTIGQESDNHDPDEKFYLSDVALIITAVITLCQGYKLKWDEAYPGLKWGCSSAFLSLILLWCGHYIALVGFRQYIALVGLVIFLWVLIPICSRCCDEDDNDVEGDPSDSECETEELLSDEDDPPESSSTC